MTKAPRVRRNLLALFLGAGVLGLLGCSSTDETPWSRLALKAPSWASARKTETPLAPPVATLDQSPPSVARSQMAQVPASSVDSRRAPANTVVEPVAWQTSAPRDAPVAIPGGSAIITFRGVTSKSDQSQPAPAETPNQRYLKLRSKVAPSAAAKARVGLPAAHARTSVPPRQPTSSVELMSGRVDEHLHYAFDLAQRGAAYSARTEFVQALELIAQAHDADNATTKYTESLAAGLRALNEADDFVPDQSRDKTQLKISLVLAAHKTPVLKDVADVDHLRPVEVLQQYYTYAAECLAFAGGNTPAASRALYGLARLGTASAGGLNLDQTLMEPKAIVLYQAALTIDANNYKAANELGVLLARFGQLGDAQAAFTHSLTISPSAETWHNLATVSRNLGDIKGARIAQERFEALSAARQSTIPSSEDPNRRDDAPSTIVQWVDTEMFTAKSGPDRVGEVRGQPRAVAVEKPSTPPKKKSNDWFAKVGDWLKLKPRNKQADRQDRPAIWVANRQTDDE